MSSLEASHKYDELKPNRSKTILEDSIFPSIDKSIASKKEKENR